jgi:hypothetical protein
MPDHGERPNEELFAPSMITPDVVTSFRSQLTTGEDVVDPATRAGTRRCTDRSTRRNAEHERITNF